MKKTISKLNSGFKRVLLICTSFQMADMPYFPPPGLGYIAQKLYENNIDYNVIDMRLEIKLSEIFDKIRHYKPDLIGISIISLNYLKTYDLINKIKSTFKDIKVAVGGPHAIMFKEQILHECKDIDFLCCSYGEEMIVDLCRGVPLNQIKNLIFKDKKDIKINNASQIKALDEYPFPKYHNFEMDRYTTKEIAIMTSRGCPYHCIFCMEPKKFYSRSPSNMFEEVNYWHSRGYTSFIIFDSNFTLIKERVIDFCNLIIKSNLKVNFKLDFGVRADKIDYEQLKLMKKAGFRYLAFGVEVGNNKMLKLIKKGETMETIDKAVKMACDLGFNVKLTFIPGLPHETEQDINDSFKFALKYPVHSAEFYNPIPYPNSELYDILKKNNYLLYPYQEYLNQARLTIASPLFYTPELSVKKRKLIMKKATVISDKIRKNYYHTYFKNKPIQKICANFFYSQFGKHILKYLDENKFLYRYKKIITDNFFTKKITQ